MSVKSHAEYDWLGRAIKVHLATFTEGRTHVAAFLGDGGSVTYEETDPAIATDPLFTFTTEEAHAIYDALGRVLERAHPERDQGRADFLHERGRVDRLVGALIEVATKRDNGGFS